MLTSCSIDGYQNGQESVSPSTTRGASDFAIHLAVRNEALLSSFPPLQQASQRNEQEKEATLNHRANRQGAAGETAHNGCTPWLCLEAQE